MFQIYKKYYRSRTILSNNNKLQVTGWISWNSYFYHLTKKKAQTPLQQGDEKFSEKKNNIYSKMKFNPV